MKRYQIYSAHKGAHIVHPITTDLGEAESLARSAAELGYDALYRVFEQTAESVTGERFVTAWSVLRGVVREHKSATIPADHW